MFAKDVYIERRRKLSSLLNKGVAVFLGNNEVPMNYPANGYHFRQDSSFLYYFGLNLPGMMGLIDFESGREILFGDNFEIDDVIWMGPQPSVKELADRCGVNETAPFSKASDYLKDQISKGRRVHFLPPYRAENKMLLSDWLSIKYESLPLYASTDLVRAVISQRSVKSPEEVAEIERAHDIAFEMHTWAMKNAHPGKFEREIAGMMEGIALSAGGHVSFPVICSIHGETLHNHYHGNQINTGDLLLVDAGAESSLMYAADITRVIPVGGTFSPRQRDIYQIVLNANNKVLELARPGLTYKSLHLEAASVIAGGLKDLGLMKGDVKEAVLAGAHALFFPHGLGHMMGLDVHDMEDLGENFVGYDESVKRSDQFGTAYLRLGKTLEPGFVITDEPGIYFIPALINLWKKEGKFVEYINYQKVEEFIGFGGVRLEDDILITPEGARLIGSKRVPIQMDEVEEMSKVRMR